MKIPNASEELVIKLCSSSFLSFWSYAMPQGKAPGKELCDILVVCDPDVIIFSIKEISYKDTGDPSIDWERWQKKAIEESCKQIYGAERWLSTAANVITQDREQGLPIPESSRRKIHRVAIALGSQGQASLKFGDFGKGFIHVFDEQSLDIVMGELDTISDFVKYLADKEALYARGVSTLFASGGEEDMLALYLHQGREFPSEPDLFVFDDDLWTTLTRKPEWQARKAADQVSYLWDRLIETLAEDTRQGNLLSTYPHSVTSLTQVELATRIMARENRFCRRLLAQNLVAFLELSRQNKVRSRIVPSMSGVQYVLLAHPHSEDRKHRVAELAGRCYVVRGLKQGTGTVIGIATEIPGLGKGSSLDVFLFDKSSWTEEDQMQVEYLQREFGYFTDPIQSRMRADEYPGT